MRETVSFSVFRTQTAPSPTAMLLGAVAASMKDAIRRPAGSMAATPFPIGDRPEASSPVVSVTIAPAIAVASTSSPAVRMARRRRRRPGARRAAAGAASPSVARAASVSSSQLGYRSSFSFASALHSTGSSAGYPGSGGGSSCRCAHRLSACVSRRNGGAPARHS